MILKICAIRDRATDSFNSPVFVMAVGQAVRSFADEINRSGDANNQMHNHPDDFDLYLLGSYDTDSGLFETSTPRQIAIGKDCVIKVSG